MSEEGIPTDEEAASLRDRLDRDARQGGYDLNPDKEFTLELARGLLVNEARYGYMACPCRLADGDKGRDIDIICPCDYRDKDLSEFGACYCALYVGEDIRDGKRAVAPIPERRPPASVREKGKGPQELEKKVGPTLQVPPLRYPVWRCTVCGYLCAREGPPLVCPVCKAKKDRFERFF